MRKHAILISVAATLLVVSALSAVALADADTPDISWWLIGGGSRIAAGRISLSGGVGQGVAGVMELGEVDACSGFWCAPPPFWPYYGVYLPLVSK